MAPGRPDHNKGHLCAPQSADQAEKLMSGYLEPPVHSPWTRRCKGPSSAPLLSTRRPKSKCHITVFRLCGLGRVQSPLCASVSPPHRTKCVHGNEAFRKGPSTQQALNNCQVNVTSAPLRPLSCLPATTSRIIVMFFPLNPLTV